MAVSRNALITGSTSGIGLGIARGLAALGHNVMLNGFADREEIEQLKADIVGTYNVKVGYSNADVSNPEAIAGAVEQTKSDLGEIDILVNNAGIQFVSPRISDREMECHHRYRFVFRFPLHPPRSSRHESARLRSHHQRRVCARAHRVAVQVGLRLGEARDRRSHENGHA